MSPRLFQWLRISLFNLLVVAFLGLILRYKIAFSLPFIDQKYLLHAHSHFAFTGWITQALMALMVARISAHKKADLFPKYRWLLYANLFTAYGMLFSFSFQGYGFFSILFSNLSIFTSWMFAVYCWKDLNRLPVKNISTYWFKAALLFNALSALGAFALAGMIANKIIHQNWYLAAIYFFLHFQYNGWFFFACMGLFIDKITAFYPAKKIMKCIFYLFVAACPPAFLLSVLWLPMPLWIYVIVVICAFAQVVGWVLLVWFLFKRKEKIFSSLTIHAKWLLTLSALALTVKLILQLGSTIPSLSTLAYGYRPIVIAYLHLILLGVFTLFLLGYIMNEKILPLTRKLILGIIVFTSGILLNELLLLMQGVAAISYVPIPFINELLLAAAAILFTGMLFLNSGIKNQT
jgi:hypothetical protein